MLFVAFCWLTAFLRRAQTTAFFKSTVTLHRWPLSALSAHHTPLHFCNTDSDFPPRHCIFQISARSSTCPVQRSGYAAWLRLPATETPGHHQAWFDVDVDFVTFPLPAPHKHSQRISRIRCQFARTALAILHQPLYVLPAFLSHLLLQSNRKVAGSLAHELESGSPSVTLTALNEIPSSKPAAGHARAPISRCVNSACESSQGDQPPSSPNLGSEGCCISLNRSPAAPRSVCL